MSDLNHEGILSKTVILVMIMKCPVNKNLPGNNKLDPLAGRKELKTSIFHCMKSDPARLGGSSEVVELALADDMQLKGSPAHLWGQRNLTTVALYLPIYGEGKNPNHWLKRWGI